MDICHAGDDPADLWENITPVTPAEFLAGLPQPCAHCHAQGQETHLTVYDRWQCTDLAACAKRQLARRRHTGLHVCLNPGLAYTCIPDISGTDREPTRSLGGT